MADVSKVTASNGTTYDIKDATARSGLSDKMDKADPTGTGSLSLNRNGNSTVGTNSVAVGYNTIASAMYSHAEGETTTASGEAAHAEGGSTKASSNASHAEGYYTEAKTNKAAHAEGYGASSYKIVSSGKGSHAEGSYNDTSGSNTVGPAASGQGSHAEGFGANVASGKGAHAEGGLGSKASGIYSHAEGRTTTASGEAAHAEGIGTTAYERCHAEGVETSATGGDGAHSEGYSTTASSAGAHSEGEYTTASGTASHAEGYYTKASSANQHVSGKYNIEDSASTYAEIIGNGTADNARSNARTLDWDGNESLAGGFQCNAMNVSSSSVTLVNPEKWRDAIFDTFPGVGVGDGLVARYTRDGVSMYDYIRHTSSGNNLLKIYLPEAASAQFQIYVSLSGWKYHKTVHILAATNANGAMDYCGYASTSPTYTSLAGSMSGTSATTCALSGTGNRMIYISGVSHFSIARVRILTGNLPAPVNVYFD